MVEQQHEERGQDLLVWPLLAPGKADQAYGFGFCAILSFPKVRDLRHVAKSLDEGVVLCSPDLICGEAHAREVLAQACEYWRRGKTIAKNRSIDLLMRLTCQPQISEAIRLSGIDAAKRIAMLGIADSSSKARQIASEVRELVGGVIDNELLELTPARAVALKKIHDLPSGYPSSKLASFLAERAVLLSFAR